MDNRSLTERERIDALVFRLGISIRQLARLVDMNENTFYHITDNSRFGISERTASKICYNLEEKMHVIVNRDWLLNGNGEMILKQRESSPHVNEVMPSDNPMKSGTNRRKMNRKEVSAYSEKQRIEDFIYLLKTNHNLVLTGAPGTGKTYLTQQIAKGMGAITKFVQFHPSYDYTDFVEGLRPFDRGDGQIGFERRDGVFKEFCKLAAKSNKEDPLGEVGNQPFVFIIDEINRGEASKIFGELFYAIDPSCRGGKDYLVQTQYQNLVPDTDVFAKGFYVPENVYILATMNDIDRSVESMDFAMRRRFTWKEVTPADTQSMLDTLSCAEEAKATMERLNNAIAEIDGLGAAYMIGPSYFLKLGKNGGDFDKLWRMNIEPLLKEYLRGFRKTTEIIDKFRKAYFGEGYEPKVELIDEN